MRACELEEERGRGRTMAHQRERLREGGREVGEEERESDELAVELREAANAESAG